MQRKHEEENQRFSHVLLIYRRMIPSIRLCGHCQMEYLAREGKLEYRAIQEMKLKSSDLNWADVVLLGRLDSWYEYQLTKKLHEAGKYLIYIIDDDLLNIPPEISSAAYYGQKEIQGYIRGMIGMSDAIMSPSPLLLQKYATDGRRAIQIEEPAIDPVPYKPHDPNKPVKIGFAGSIDRTGDIENILKDALIQIKQEYGDKVQFEFFGAIPSFARELDARCIPYCDSYDEYRKTLNSLEWDIGLAPMPDTPFHACKHYNKFIEYAAAGIVGVFSDVEPYRRLRDVNAPGAYCENNPKAWYLVISSLIGNPKYRSWQRKACIEMAWNEFSIVHSEATSESVCGIRLGNPGSEKKIKGLQVIRVRSLGYVIYEKWRTYGIRMPMVAVQRLSERMKNKCFRGRKNEHGQCR